MNLPDPSIRPPTTSDQSLDWTMLGMENRSPKGAKRLAKGQERMVRKKLAPATPFSKPRIALWVVRYSPFTKAMKKNFANW